MIRNKIRYLLLLACSGLLLILFNKYYIGIIFLTVVVMPLILFGLLSYIYGNIKAELDCATHVVNKNERIPVSVQLSNSTMFPVSCVKLYLEYQNTYSGQRYKKTVFASIDSKTKTSVVLGITSQYAGNMKITLVGFRIYDYMKLFSLRRKTTCDIKVAVLPAYYELENYEFINRSTSIIDSDTYSTIRKGDDPSEVFEIREYREGDRLQRIHWKLSMKQDQLMIKEFSDPVSCSILIFVNLNTREGEKAILYMDAILECAISLSYTFLMKEQIHYLSWYNKEQNECIRVLISDEKDLFDAINGLLNAYPFTESIDELTVYQAQYPHDRYSNLFVISPEVSELNIDSLSIIKADTRQMIYMSNTKKFEKSASAELLQKYKETGINWCTLDMANVKSEMEQLSWV